MPDRASSRRGPCAFTAILFVLVTGLPWRLVPQEMGCSGVTAWRRLRDWQATGVWARLHRELLRRLNATGRLDWSLGVVDGSHIRALRGGQLAGPSPVDRARTGSKRHLIVDLHGITPLCDIRSLSISAATARTGVRPMSSTSVVQRLLLGKDGPPPARLATLAASVSGPQGARMLPARWAPDSSHGGRWSGRRGPPRAAASRAQRARRRSSAAAASSPRASTRSAWRTDSSALRSRTAAARANACLRRSASCASSAAPGHPERASRRRPSPQQPTATSPVICQRGAPSVGPARALTSAPATQLRRRITAASECDTSERNRQAAPHHTATTVDSQIFRGRRHQAPSTGAGHIACRRRREQWP